MWVLGSVPDSKNRAKLIDVIASRYNERLNLEAMMVLSRARSCAIDANRLTGRLDARAREWGGDAPDILKLQNNCAPNKYVDTNIKMHDNELVIIYFNHHERTQHVNTDT